jgi:asparagine synthase (glutamine-hydrolysing)
MCGITGWVDWSRPLEDQLPILQSMTEALRHRGPDAAGTWIKGNCALGHTRLSVMDPAGGAQPMLRSAGGRLYTIVYNGEIYNAPELKRQLELRGWRFQTRCDTEVLLHAFIEWGPACLEKLNGIFAFAVWDDAKQTLFLARDRLGVKPLFYSYGNERLLFGSEPKALLAHPSFPAEVDAEGLAELLAIGPARTPGHGIYRRLSELKPGWWLEFTRDGVSSRPYWTLESRPHEDNEETTAERIRELLEDTVSRQLMSDVPLASLLSGGVDSSALTALAVRTGQSVSSALPTFSVDYAENDKYFRPHAYQPNSDAPWVRRMSEYLGTAHHAIELDASELFHSLEASVKARDLPGMADIDGSLYLFCREIKRHVTVALSGEGADEVFGGYPWFHREDLIEADTFPWSVSLQARTAMLSDEVVSWIRPEDYVRRRYLEALDEVPRLPGETPRQARLREMTYLNITRFMPTLLDRKDRMSMAHGLEVRVPFCDHRIVQYVWNIPWELRTSGQREKGILRKALRGLLPEDVLYRKKSPYPKTHHPAYWAKVRDEMRQILLDPGSPIAPLIQRERFRKQLEQEEQPHLPWFGQLMSGVQWFAYWIQLDLWMRRYNIRITND